MYPEYPEQPAYPDLPTFGNGGFDVTFPPWPAPPPLPEPTPAPDIFDMGDGAGYGAGISPDVGIVKYAVYPGEPLDVNLLDPLSRMVYEHGRATGFFLKNLFSGESLRKLVPSWSPFEWFKGAGVPSVEAQPQKPVIEPAPTSYVTAPKPSMVGYIPQVMRPSPLKEEEEFAEYQKPKVAVPSFLAGWT